MAIKLPIGKKIVFVDWSHVAAGYGLKWTTEGEPRPDMMPSGVEIRIFRPHYSPEQIVILADRPWERRSINAYSTWFEDEGKFRLYYEPYTDQDKGDFSARMAYAESDDGHEWRKPDVGEVEFGGSTENNLILATENNFGRGPHGGHVFKDSSAPAEERYKLVHCAPTEEGMHLVVGAVSADGIVWRALEERLLHWWADTQTVMYWDPDQEHYKGYFRGWRYDAIAGGRRTVEYAVTEDFYDWPEPELCLSTDANDPPGTDIYTNSFTPWPGALDAYLMFPCFYPRTPDTMETHFAVSRDGRNWFRPLREPYMGAGPPDSDYYGGMFLGQGIISLEPGVWAMLASPCRKTHNQGFYDKEVEGMKSLSYVTIREDGFMAIEAEAEGEFWTVLLELEGKRLQVNAWTHFGGKVRVEVCDESGAPIEGYTLADCVALTGDCLFDEVRFQEHEDLAELKGRTVRLHFRLTRGRLYSFRTEGQ